MSTDIVEAISHLWPLAFIVFLILCVVIFKKQLGGLLDRLSKLQVKRGQTEISAETYDTKKAEIKEMPVSDEKPTEAIEQAPKPEPVTSDEWNREMVLAYIIRRDEKRGEEAFNKAQQKEPNANKRLKNESLHFRLRYDYGDTSALAKLQDIAKQEGLDNSVKPIVYKYLGYCYQDANNYDKAIEAFEIAAQVPQTEAERAGHIVEIAKCLYKMKKQPEALKRIMHEIGNVTHADASLILYQGLASLYEQAENHEFRAIALEKALEIEPNNADLRFNAAYSYGEKEYRSLSLYHYKTLLQFKPDYAMALNNIGAQYKLLEMPISSVIYYKKAIELGETIAMGNIARQYLEAGFEEEASQIVDKAKQKEKPHPNVGRAMSAISEAKEAESKKLERELKFASEQQSHIRNFADAYFNEKSDCPSFSGSWHTFDGIEMKIAQKEAEIEGYWTSAKTKYKITGTAVNRGVTVSIYKEEYVWSSPNKYEFVIDTTGYAYLAPDGQKLFILTLKNNMHTFMELSKVE